MSRRCAIGIILLTFKRTYSGESSRTNLVTVEEIIADCQRELALLRGIPATPVARAELWIRFPNGSWRYFLVTSDGMTEIPAEAAAQTPEGKAPVYEDAAGPDRHFVRYEGTVIDVEPLLSKGPVPDQDSTINRDPEPDRNPEKPVSDQSPPARAGPYNTT